MSDSMENRIWEASFEDRSFITQPIKYIPNTLTKISKLINITILKVITELSGRLSNETGTLFSCQS